MNKTQYVFGPVPSRRLGFSLGIDISPKKACTFDCIYCEVGHTNMLSSDRQAWYDPDTVTAQVKERLETGPKPDYVTFSGSGEPTLNSNLGNIIRSIKDITDVPLAVITNSSLLFLPQVREELRPADVLLPTLLDPARDAFARIHRPAPGLGAGDISRGLRELRDWFSGMVRLEVMIMAGINDSDADIAALAMLASEIRPDIIDINTLVRPAPTNIAHAVGQERLVEIAAAFGTTAQIIAPFSKNAGTERAADEIERSILSTVAIRPLTLEDIRRLAALGEEEASVFVKELLRTGKLELREQNGTVFYAASRG